MKNFTQEKAINITLLLLRIFAMIMFIQVGGFKLFNWFGGMASVGATMTPLMWVAGTLEVFGGLAILLGLFTRPVAFILSGEMAFAYFLGHASNGLGFWPMQNHGEQAILYCFMFLFLAAYGAGKYSLDAMMKRKKDPMVCPVA
jgi:putative oxidoreductase